MMPLPTAADLVPVLPELVLCGAAFGLLLADLFVDARRRGLIHALALLSLLVTVLLIGRGMAGDPISAFGGMFIRDTLADVLKIAMCGVTAVVLLYARPYLEERGLMAGEFYAIVLFALLGMLVMVSSGHLVMLYLGLEMLALSSYGLVAMDRDNKVASEAGMKYFVLGALASGLLLYGMSMVYGATGSLDLAASSSAPRPSTCGCPTCTRERRPRSRCSSAPCPRSRPSVSRTACSSPASDRPPSSGRRWSPGWPSCRW